MQINQIGIFQCAQNGGKLIKKTERSNQLNNKYKSFQLFFVHIFLRFLSQFKKRTKIRNHNLTNINNDLMHCKTKK